MSNTFINRMIKKEIESYHKERINYYIENNNCDKFMLLHIIPYVCENYNEIFIKIPDNYQNNMFSIFGCDEYCSTFVGDSWFDASWVKSTARNSYNPNDHSICTIDNDGIEECCICLDSNSKYSSLLTNSILYKKLIKDIKIVYNRYLGIINKDLLYNQSIYLCISIFDCSIGCSIFDDLKVIHLKNKNIL